MTAVDLTEIKTLMDKYSPEKVDKQYHILIYDNNLMCCTLNQTNIADNSNKFFLMQLLKHDRANSYCLYTRSGRVGYEGTWNCDLYIYIADALADFHKKFLEKTGILWDNRYKKLSETELLNRENKYIFIEMKHEQILSEEEIIKKNAALALIKAKNEVKLDNGVRGLISLIYDIDMYKDSMAELNIDAKRLPLGKLSLNQIEKAYQIISYLSNNLTTLDPKDIVKLSSQFYTIIPYASGMSAPPVIDDQIKIKEKIDQLKSLDDIVVAAENMSDPAVKSLDEKYLALKCGLTTVTDQKITGMIIDYIKNTSAQTHNFKIKVKNIFEVKRSEESDRFHKFANSKNRQLLWHGSRLCNFVGILSKGLRINPSNVIKTGSMFGNGIYFSNTASKSAQYVYSKKDAIMMLCEVALGDCYKLTQSKYITSLPEGKGSTYGMGGTTPDPNGSLVLQDGLIVPCGELIPSGVASSLLYDEFIVYDVSQVRIRYLVHMDL